MKKRNGIIKAVSWTVGTIIVLLALLHLGVTVIYSRFFMGAESKFLVPGLDSPFVHQGFEYVSEEDVYLVSGYMKDGSASRVYIREDGGDVRFAQLKNADGTDNTGHAGGICYNGRYAFVAGENGVNVFLLADILDGGDATAVGKIETGFDVAFCAFIDGHLLAGEFYRSGNYETDPSHWQTTPAGEENPALIAVFRGDETEAFGIGPEPVAAISIPGLVQGICFTEEQEMVLSTSYGFASSHLSYHRIDTEKAGRIEMSGVEVPLLYLDSATLTERVAVPPMAEELVYRDGQVYIMCESASNKYIFGKFIRGYQVFAYEKEGEN